MEDYKTDFEADIAASSSRIVIAVPYLSKYDVHLASKVCVIEYKVV